MDNFPPICKQKPPDVRAHYVYEHWKVTGETNTVTFQTPCMVVLCQLLPRSGKLRRRQLQKLLMKKLLNLNPLPQLLATHRSHCTSYPVARFCYIKRGMWTYFLRLEEIGEDQKQLYTWEGLCQWVDLSKEESGIHYVWTSQAVLGF